MNAATITGVIFAHSTSVKSAAPPQRANKFKADVMVRREFSECKLPRYMSAGFAPSGKSSTLVGTEWLDCGKAVIGKEVITKIEEKKSKKNGRGDLHHWRP